MELNKEVIDGLKKRLRLLENKLKREKKEGAYLEEKYKIYKEEKERLESEIKGLTELLKPYLVVEKL